MRFSIVCLYIIVLFLIVLPKTSALSPWPKDRENSICTKVTTKLMTVFVPYEEEYHSMHFFDLFPRPRTRINYKLEYKTHYTIENTCCEGYEESLDICFPICSPKCDGGLCVSRNYCSCYGGYERISSTVCRPTCENKCINGTCIKPNTCKCDEGFVLHEDNVTASVCKPFCSSPCGPYTECTAPDLCTCEEGYRVVENNNTTDDVLDSKNITCIPVCENDCVNGKCVSPNVCVCEDGYSMDLVNTTNYRHSNHCQSICEEFCGPNVKCDAPDDCVCDQDYHNITLSDDKRVCQPICESSCINGTCIAPNTCQCDEDFVEIKINDLSTCVSACSRNCSGHGTCLDEFNTCLCFYGWTGWDCDESSVCVYKTKLDSPLLSSVTVINETNSTLMESYDNAPLCYQCSDSLNNETLCLAVQSDESLTIPTVGCFLSTELPCYRRPQHNAFKRSNHMAVSLIGVTIAIIVIAALAGYAIVQKRKKQRTISVNVQAVTLSIEDMDALIVPHNE